MTSSKPKKLLWIFCPEMTLPDVPEIPQIGVNGQFFEFLPKYYFHQGCTLLELVSELVL